MSDIRVVQQEYHRNGIGGAGFVVSLVEWPEAQANHELVTPHFLAVSFFGESGTRAQKVEAFRSQTAVFALDHLMSANIVNAWRGADRIGPAVVEAYTAKCAAEKIPWDPFEGDDI